MGTPAESFLHCSWRLAEVPAHRSFKQLHYCIDKIQLYAPQNIKLVMSHFIPWNSGLAITCDSVIRPNNFKILYRTSPKFLKNQTIGKYNSVLKTELSMSKALGSIPSTKYNNKKKSKQLSLSREPRTDK